MLQSYTKYNLHQLIFLLILMYVTINLILISLIICYMQIHNRKYQVQSLLFNLKVRVQILPSVFKKHLKLKIGMFCLL